MAFLRKMFSRSQSTDGLNQSDGTSCGQTQYSHILFEPSTSESNCETPFHSIHHTSLQAGTDRSITDYRNHVTVECDWMYSSSRFTSFNIKKSGKELNKHSHTSSSIMNFRSKGVSRSKEGTSENASLEEAVLNECVFDMLLLNSSHYEIHMALVISPSLILLATSDGSVILYHIWKESFCGIKSLHSKSISAWRIVEEFTNGQMDNCLRFSLFTASLDKYFCKCSIVSSELTTKDDSISYSWDSNEENELKLFLKDDVIRCMCHMEHDCHSAAYESSIPCHIRYHIITGGAGLRLWSNDGICLDQMSPDVFDQEDIHHLLALQRDNLLVCSFHKFLSLIRVTCTRDVPTERGCHCVLENYRRLIPHQEPVRALVSIQPGSGSFLSASLDGAILLWSGLLTSPQGLFNAHHNYFGPTHGFPFSVQSVQVLWNRLLLCSIGMGFSLFDISFSCPLLSVNNAHGGVKTTQVRYITLPCPWMNKRDGMCGRHGTTLETCGQKLLVSCGEDGDVRLWEVASKRLTEFVSHYSSVSRWMGVKKENRKYSDPNEEATTASEIYFLDLSLTAILEKVAKQGGRPIYGLLHCRKELRGHNSAISDLLVIPDELGLTCGLLTFTENREVIFWKLRRCSEDCYIRNILLKHDENAHSSNCISLFASS